MINPNEAFSHVEDGQLDEKKTSELLEFIQKAPSRQLAVFLLLCSGCGKNIGFINHWSGLARICMQVRIGEENVAAANALADETRKLTALSENLTKLTTQHVEHSNTLTKQTDILINESKGLRRLTWGLLLLTAALLANELRKDFETKSPPPDKVQNR